MTTKLMTCLLATITLTTLAQVKEKEKGKFPQRANIQERRQKMMLRRFDTNKDGKLDEAEKDAMKQYQAEGQGRRERGEQTRFTPEQRQEMIKKFDKDGDGKLNAEERKAMMEERRKKMQAEGQGRRERGEQPRFTPEQRQEMIKKFDKDGDGKLNAEERKAAMQARRQERPRAINPQKREDMIKKYDLDGDGKLSREERQKMHEDIMANAKNVEKEDAE